MVTTTRSVWPVAGEKAGTAGGIRERCALVLLRDDATSWSSCELDNPGRAQWPDGVGRMPQDNDSLARWPNLELRSAAPPLIASLNGPADRDPRCGQVEHGASRCVIRS
jgi:hypothetical protein